MIKNGVKTVVLYLEGWQKRMVKDFLGIDCDKYEVSLGGDPVLHMRYGLPTDEQLKRMYFTEWQIREMKDTAGFSCEFIELHKSAIGMLYMAPV